MASGTDNMTDKVFQHLRNIAPEDHQKLKEDRASYKEIHTLIEKVINENLSLATSLRGKVQHASSSDIQRLLSRTYTSGQIECMRHGLEVESFRELYLSLDRVKEAEMCVTETTSIFPLSHQVAFMKGRVYEHRQRYSEAKTCYENAISINPSHTKSLQHLGMVLHCLDNNTLAEKVLRDAVNADPILIESWYCLGVVLEALGQSEAAAECQIMALDLEATSPIVPFTVIPRLMQ